MFQSSSDLKIESKAEEGNIPGFDLLGGVLHFGDWLAAVNESLSFICLRKTVLIYSLFVIHGDLGELLPALPVNRVLEAWMVRV